MSTPYRPYDLVLWGATGFMGRLVAAHLAESGDSTELDWAIAGRNRDELTVLRDRLADVDPELSTLDLLLGDAMDQDSLDAIAEQTRVVCSTVGPYAKYGSKLVAACLEQGTDYCDLSGEVQWIRQMIDEHHEDARESGVRIVTACGFDSIPSDLGTLLVQRDAEETFGTTCSTVKAFVTTSSSVFSGGTLASTVGTYEAISADPDIRRLVDDPHALAEDGNGYDPLFRRGANYDSDIGQWTAPFVMTLINEKIVYRTNFLLGYPWGRDFEYDETMPTGHGPTGAMTATALSGGLAFMDWVMSVGPVRSMVDKYVFPDPGTGPSRQTIERNTIELWLLGTGTSQADGDFTVEARFESEQEAYGTSAVMVAEAARCLALDEIDSPLSGGVLTPATGIGTPLVDRLRDVGMTISVGEQRADDKRM